LVRSPRDKVEVTKIFYENLYTWTKNDETLHEQEHFLHHLSNADTSEQNDYLCAPVTKAEINNVVTEMKNGKTPGPDGISIEFYKKFWYVISDQFTAAVNAILSGEYEYQFFKQAYITL